MFKCGELEALYNQQMFFSPMCRVTKSWCPSRLSARLMAHGINPCPAVKVSDLRTGITTPAVAFLLQNVGNTASLTHLVHP